MTAVAPVEGSRQAVNRPQDGSSENAYQGLLGHRQGFLADLLSMIFWLCTTASILLNISSL